MAEAGNAGKLPAAQSNLGVTAIVDNPWLRQLVVMVGIAASVALGVAVVLWSQAPSFAPLYGSMAEKDASQVMEALQQSGAEFRVDEASGMVMVPSAKLKEIRMAGSAQQRGYGIRVAATGNRFRQQPDGRAGEISTRDPG